METIRILDEPPLKLQQVEGKEQYDVTLGLSWGPPLTPYGADEYEVYVGDRPQGSISIANPLIIDRVSSWYWVVASEHIKTTFISISSQIQMTNITLEGEIIPVSEGRVCIIAQVSIPCGAKILPLFHS